MIADTFKKDYRQMTAQGVKFTPEDIILLNALAVKVRLSQNAARTTHLPRLAFLPGRLKGGTVEWLKSPWNFSTFPLFHSSTLVLREPTIAHEMWLEQAQRYITIDSNRTFDLLHAYALAHPAEKLPDVFDPKRLIRKVFTWCARHLAHLTREQLSAAVDYCLFGADWKAGESGPAKNNTGATGVSPVGADDNTGATGVSPVGADDSSSATIGLLTEARALRLPISLSDAKQMTASELDEAITRCLAKDHKIDYDAERNRAMGDYVRTRNAIRKRSERPTEEPQVPDGKDGSSK